MKTHYKTRIQKVKQEQSILNELKNEQIQKYDKLNNEVLLRYEESDEL